MRVAEKLANRLAAMYLRLVSVPVSDDDRAKAFSYVEMLARDNHAGHLV
jgi:hypothetical protein